MEMRRKVEMGRKVVEQCTCKFLSLPRPNKKLRVSFKTVNVVIFNPGNSYLDTSTPPHHHNNNNGTGGPTLLAQYIYNMLCRAGLSASGRTRKALVVTLGDDVIG